MLICRSDASEWLEGANSRGPNKVTRPSGSSRGGSITQTPIIDRPIHQDTARGAPLPVDPAGPDSSPRPPFYLPSGNEIEVFEAAYQSRLPVLLKGPTGCGKTRFIEHMVHRLFVQAEAPASRRAIERPLVTVSCHEDLTATDLVGRYLLRGEETVWIDGPLTQAVRSGAVCYLDEIVEARKDTTVLIHALTDHRRILPIEKRSAVLEAHPDFLLVISYNPGYQSAAKDLKPSTRQRFVALELDYPPVDREAQIIEREAGVAAPLARDLAELAVRIRALESRGSDLGASTRLLIYAGQLAASGLGIVDACEVAISRAISDDREVQRAVQEIVTTLFA